MKSQNLVLLLGEYKPPKDVKHFRLSAVLVKILESNTKIKPVHLNLTNDLQDENLQMISVSYWKHNMK